MQGSVEAESNEECMRAASTRCSLAIPNAFQTLEYMSILLELKQIRNRAWPLALVNFDEILV